MWKSLNVSIFFVYCQFYCTILILILWTPSTSVIIHTCIHVHQIKLVYIHCSTLCNLVLWWKKNVLACSKAENLILCLCPLQLKWSERQENMRVSLNLFSSIFSLFILCLYIKVKKVFYWTLSVGLNYYRRVCDMQSVSCEIDCAHAHFPRYFELRQLGKFSWMTHYF